MDRAKKVEQVDALSQVFSETGVVVVAHYSGLTVVQMEDLRRRMGAAGAKLKVIKNRLAKRALSGKPSDGASGLFKGPTAIAYSKDPTAAPKIATAYARENDKLVILGGMVGNTILDVEGVKNLATLPSLDELRGKLLGLLNAPATRIAGVVQAPAGQIARVIQAFADKSAA